MKSESFSIYMEYNQFIWSICSESSKIIMIISSNNLIKTRTIKKKNAYIKRKINPQIKCIVIIIILSLIFYYFYVFLFSSLFHFQRTSEFLAFILEQN